MQIRHLVCLSAVLILAACGGSGGDHGDGPSKTATTATKSIPPLSKSEAAKALLTLDDLPKGWKNDPDDGSGDGVKVTKGSKACKDLMEGDDDDPATAQASFKLAEAGPFLDHEIYSYDSSKADKEFTEGVKAFAACRSFTMGDSEFSMDLKVKQVSFDGVGDDSAAFEAVGTYQEGFQMHIEFLFVRDGRNIVSCNSMALGKPFPHEQLTKLMAVAIQRLDGLQTAA